MSELEPGQVVYMKASTNTGGAGTIVNRDSASENYWVKVGSSDNRKHVLLNRNFTKRSYNNINGYTGSHVCANNNTSNDFYELIEDREEVESWYEG